MLLAKSESKLKEMIKRFRKFLEKKGLSLSFNNSKVIVFEKKKERMRKKE